ncbi:VOC family protein [Shewanella sp. A25]|nr:VOC family protein [Shewanella shenzhenensis]
MNRHNSINYLEIPTTDIASSKAFFNKVFGWQFQDYGPEYSCFLDVGINGGFYQSNAQFTLEKGSPLIVLYSKALDETQAAITAAGGTICKAIFSFPGGRRFHFTEPCGNEYAVWSE